MKPEEFLKLPKKFCENAFVSVNAESFIITICSGTEASGYVFSAEHAKRLCASLSQTIGFYESQLGNIDPNPKPLMMPSPISSTDLSDPKKK
jgi:hypothetical protein